MQEQIFTALFWQTGGGVASVYLQIDVDDVGLVLRVGHSTIAE